MVAEVMAGHASTGTAREMRLMVKGTLLLAFVLIVTLLIVGLLGAYREWMRYRDGDGEGGGGRKRVRTKYVDAWKIAGERLKVKDSEEDHGE